jgi:hypothetical protein
MGIDGARFCSSRCILSNLLKRFWLYAKLRPILKYVAKNLDCKGGVSYGISCIEVRNSWHVPPQTNLTGYVFGRSELVKLKV